MTNKRNKSSKNSFYRYFTIILFLFSGSPLPITFFADRRNNSKSGKTSSPGILSATKTILR